VGETTEIERLRAELTQTDAHGEGLFVRCSQALDPDAMSPHGSEEELVAGIAAMRTERDRLQRACDEGLPREVIHCPSCGKPHAEGPRHDDPAKDGRTRPHHSHRCYDCGHVWDSERWTFGVAPGEENVVTLRLRAEGRAAGLREALGIVQGYQRGDREPDDSDAIDHAASLIGQALAEVSRG
jgi:hypothetical protein